MVWENFLEQFSDFKFRNAVNSLFSVYEKQIIINRLAAALLIRQGASTREIERSLWLSRTTIGALRKSLFNKSVDYGSPRSSKRPAKNKGNILDRSLVSQWSVGFLDGIDLLELLKNPPRPTGLGVTKQSDV